MKYKSIMRTSHLFLKWFLIAVTLFSIPVHQNGQSEKQETEYEKLLERDKKVPRERVERAFAEAKKIQVGILAIMLDKMPEFVLKRDSVGHLRSGNGLTYSSNPGRLGSTYNEFSWQNKNTRVFLNFHLGFSNEDSLERLRRSISGISMGEFFDFPNFADEATLVKNVVYNKEATSVSIHFVKGRAAVSIYLQNFQRNTEKNEKELMKIAKLIEPLIVARLDFDDH